MLGRHEEAIASWQRSLAIDSSPLDDENIAFRYTITLARVGRYQEAAELYERMLSSGVSQELRPIVLLNMADMIVATSCGGLDEAIELYQECVRDYPNEASGHWGLAAALFRAGRAEQATRELAAAERLDSRWRSVNGPDVFFVPAYEVHLYRALGWQQRGNPGQARLEWQAYLEGGGSGGCWGELAQRTMEGLGGGSR
jgi:pentatricopeptide repeat protein